MKTERTYKSDDRNAQWIEDIRHGTTVKANAAFAELYEAYEPLVRRVIKERVDKPDDRDELTNDTFRKVWQGIINSDSDLKLGSYVATAAKNLVKNYYRDKQSRRETVEGVAATENLASSFDGTEMGEDGGDISNFFEEVVSVDRGNWMAIDDGHRDARERPIMTRPFDPVSEELEADETRAIIAQIILDLPSERIEPLTHVIQGNLSQIEIAEKFDVSTATLRRWTRDLQEQIANHPDIDAGGFSWT